MDSKKYSIDELMSFYKASTLTCDHFDNLKNLYYGKSEYADVSKQYNKYNKLKEEIFAKIIEKLDTL